MDQSPPSYPAGAYVAPGEFHEAARQSWIGQMEQFPQQLAGAIDSLGEDQLGTRYRNWTVRQIVHHLADSHTHAYIRFKWALTEATPRIKPYDETVWSALTDSQNAPVSTALSLLTGVHAKWGHLLRTLDEAQWRCGFFHPERDLVVSLQEALPEYVWHGHHHLAQIQWLRHRHHWPEQ